MKKTTDEWIEYFKNKYPDLHDLHWQNLYIPVSIDILHDREKFLETADFSKEGGTSIALLAIYCFEQVKDKIPWEKLVKDELNFALYANPKIVKYCHLEGLDQFDWGFILSGSPELIDYCPISTINQPGVVATIIHRQKHLAKYFSPEMLQKAAAFDAEVDKKDAELKPAADSLTEARGK